MKESTLSRKQAARELGTEVGQWLMGRILHQGKQAWDDIKEEMGRIVVESVMLLEREAIAGPDYHPKNPAIKKWASQPGSVFIGNHRKRVNVPRLRGPQGELVLESYERLKKRDVFSEQLLSQWLAGMSGRRYEWLIEDANERLGGSASSVSRHLVQVSAKRLEQFRERALNGFEPFAVFLDSVHRGGRVFIVGLGINIEGKKQVLGFWEGATENREICKELLDDVERRGLHLHSGVIYITDGGKGIIKELRLRYGNKLLHQRCTVHKARNIVRHLPERYRGEFHRRYNRALEMASYEDAHREFISLRSWLKKINSSAADSLTEGMPELLTLHQLNVPASLRRVLRSTNGIESLFSRVRYYEKQIRRYRNTSMSQRWLGTVLLHSEKGFRRIKGYRYIAYVQESIVRWQNTVDINKVAA